MLPGPRRIPDRGSGWRDTIEYETERMQEAMREASEWVLPGFPLKTDAKVVRHPERFSDPRGERMWSAVWRILGELDTCEVRHR